MDTTKRDIRPVEGMVKRTQTAWGKIVPMKISAVKKTIWLFQDPMTCFHTHTHTHKKEEIIEVKYKRNIPFLGVGKIVETHESDLLCHCNTLN